jgi:hypothetical protein
VECGEGDSGLLKEVFSVGCDVSGMLEEFSVWDDTSSGVFKALG